MSGSRGAGNNRAVSTATASSFLNTAGKVGRVTISERIEAGRRGLREHGTASDDRGLETAGLPPLAVRMQSASWASTARVQRPASSSTNDAAARDRRVKLESPSETAGRTGQDRY